MMRSHSNSNSIDDFDDHDYEYSDNYYGGTAPSHKSCLKAFLKGPALQTPTCRVRPPSRNLKKGRRPDDRSMNSGDQLLDNTASPRKKERNIRGLPSNADGLNSSFSFPTASTINSSASSSTATTSSSNGNGNNNKVKNRVGNVMSRMNRKKIVATKVKVKAKLEQKKQLDSESGGIAGVGTTDGESTADMSGNSGLELLYNTNKYNQNHVSSNVANGRSTNKTKGQKIKASKSNNLISFKGNGSGDRNDNGAFPSSHQQIQSPTNTDIPFFDDDDDYDDYGRRSFGRSLRACAPLRRRREEDFGAIAYSPPTPIHGRDIDGVSMFDNDIDNINQMEEKLWTNLDFKHSVFKREQHTEQSQEELLITTIQEQQQQNSFNNRKKETKDTVRVQSPPESPTIQIIQQNLRQTMEGHETSSRANRSVSSSSTGRRSRARSRGSRGSRSGSRCSRNGGAGSAEDTEIEGEFLDTLAKVITKNYTNLEDEIYEMTGKTAEERRARQMQQQNGVQVPIEIELGQAGDITEGRQQDVSSEDVSEIDVDIDGSSAAFSHSGRSGNSGSGGASGRIHHAVETDPFVKNGTFNNPDVEKRFNHRDHHGTYVNDVDDTVSISGRSRQSRGGASARSGGSSMTALKVKNVDERSIGWRNRENGDRSVQSGRSGVSMTSSSSNSMHKSKKRHTSVIPKNSLLDADNSLSDGEGGVNEDFFQDEKYRNHVRRIKAEERDPSYAFGGSGYRKTPLSLTEAFEDFGIDDRIYTGEHRPNDTFEDYDDDKNAKHGRTNEQGERYLQNHLFDDDEHGYQTLPPPPPPPTEHLYLPLESKKEMQDHQLFVKNTDNPQCDRDQHQEEQENHHQVLQKLAPSQYSLKINQRARKDDWSGDIKRRASPIRVLPASQQMRGDTSNEHNPSMMSSHYGRSGQLARTENVKNSGDIFQHTTIGNGEFVLHSSNANYQDIPKTPFKPKSVIKIEKKHRLGRTQSHSSHWSSSSSSESEQQQWPSHTISRTDGREEDSFLNGSDTTPRGMKMERPRSSPQSISDYKDVNGGNSRFVSSHM